MIILIVLYYLFKYAHRCDRAAITFIHIFTHIILLCRIFEYLNGGPYQDTQENWIIETFTTLLVAVDLDENLSNEGVTIIFFAIYFKVISMDHINLELLNSFTRFTD